MAHHRRPSHSAPHRVRFSAHPFAVILFSLLLSQGIACHGTAATTQQGRDDVPPEYIEMKNPHPELAEANVKYFKKQLKVKCGRCHGEDGTGGTPESEGQEFPPRDFTDTEYMQTRTDGQLFYQILMGGGERCAMPAYGPESDHAWNEDKIWQMVTYLRRLSDPALKDKEPATTK